MKVKIIVLVLIFTIGNTCISQNVSKYQETDTIPLDPNVRYGKLDNGFTYYILKNEEPKNTVELRLVVKAGTIHEDEDQLEYAHLLEHLLVGKTKNFSNIKEYFSKIGGYRNAQTGSRLTIYEARVSSQDKELVIDGIRLLRDWAQGILYDSEYINVQRGAVEGEKRVSDPYRKWIGKTTEREVLKNTSYNVYSDDKRLESLQNFNPEAFTRYYNDWYRPDLQAAVIVGDINVDSMEYEIKRRFLDIEIQESPRSAKAKLDANTIQLDASIRYTTVQDSVRQELNLSIIRLRPNFASHPKTLEDFYKMLLQQLYAIIMDTKAKQLQEQYEPPFSIFSTNYVINQIPDKQVDGSRMNIALEKNDLLLMKKQFQRGLTAWKKMNLSLTQADLQRAKTALLKKYTADDVKKSNFLVSRYLQHFLYGKAAPHPEMESNLKKDLLDRIELKDIQKFTMDYGELDKNTIFIFFKGTKVDMPEHEVFIRWLKETDTLNIEPLPEKNFINSLSDVVEIPITSLKNDVTVKENEIGVSTVELPNGVKIVLKPTLPRTSYYENTVSIQAFRPNQVPVQNRQEYLTTKVIPEVLHSTGAGPYNKFQLDRFKQGKEINLYFHTTKDNQMISASSKFDDLSELFNLLYLYLTEPRKDQKAFEAWKTEKKEYLEGKGIRGSSGFVMEKITAAWYPQIPVLGINDLEKLSLEEVSQATKKWFSGIENFTFIVTGDFNKDSLLPVLIKNISAFPVRNDSSLTAKMHFAFPLKRMEKSIEFKNIQQVYVRLFFPLKVPRDIKTEIELRLISIALNERINKRLRTGSYSPVARGEWQDIRNGIYTFQIDFDSALGNEDLMIEYAKEEFRNLRENGVEKEWLEIAINNELGSYESGFSSFGLFNFWPVYLQLKLEESMDPLPGILNYGTLLEHFVSLDDINSAIKKYLSETHFQQFIGYPEGYHRVK